MDLTILGEYGLKTALNVGLRLKKLYTSEVDDGIIAAFEFALNDWSKHTPTSSDKVRLSKALEGYIQSSTSYEALDADTQKFIDCFKKRLSEQPVAHRYLMMLRADMQAKSEEQNLLEHHKTQELIQGLMAQLGGLNMSPQDIQALLKELPLEQGLERTESALEEMCSKGRIHSEGAKRLVLEFVRFLFEHTDKISEETKLLREAGDNYLAETLEELKKVLTGESEQSLTDVHKKYQEQVQQDEIRILKELIEAAQIQFSFGEARDFYERLIELAPTIEHHFNYAYLLQSLNDFKIARKHYEKVLHTLRVVSGKDPEVYKPYVAMILNNLGMLLNGTYELQKAQACYEEALQMYRELSGKNPEAYKPYVAMTLNNLASLLRNIRELQQAQACYEEALQIRRELAGQSPEPYRPYVATTLNNLGNLLCSTNQLQQAQACYQEALQIYRELSGKNPEAYMPYVATTLNNLGILLKDTNEHKQARAYYDEALEIYRELSNQNPEAYRSYVAMSLNNLGSLLQATNEHRQARAYYDEALEIYRELAKCNPFVYSPNVAMTLNSLFVLYLSQKRKEEAEKAYQEAHDIYQELAGRHPRAYEIDYAGILGVGFAFFSKPKEDLEEAKEILDKYPEHPKAQELQRLIEELANG